MLDSDFPRSADDMKSTFGYVFKFAGGAILWKSVKQTIIASSTMYAYFIACYGASIQAIWLENFVFVLTAVLCFQIHKDFLL